MQHRHLPFTITRSAKKPCGPSVRPKLRKPCKMATYRLSPTRARCFWAKSWTRMSGHACRRAPTLTARPKQPSRWRPITMRWMELAWPGSLGPWCSKTLPVAPLSARLTQGCRSPSKPGYCACAKAQGTARLRHGPSSPVVTPPPKAFRKALAQAPSKALEYANSNLREKAFRNAFHSARRLQNFVQAGDIQGNRVALHRRRCSRRLSHRAKLLRGQAHRLQSRQARVPRPSLKRGGRLIRRTIQGLGDPAAHLAQTHRRYALGTARVLFQNEGQKPPANRPMRRG